MRTLIMAMALVAGCTPDPVPPGFNCVSAEGSAGELTISSRMGTNLGRDGFIADRFDHDGDTAGDYRVTVFGTAAGTTLKLDVHLPEVPRLRTNYPVVFRVPGAALPMGSASVDYREDAATTLPLQFQSGGGMVHTYCSTTRADMPGYSVVVLRLEDVQMQAVPQTPTTGTFKISGLIKASAVKTP
jgi:hypothetical protein